MKTCVIYKITSTITNKSYIGQTKNSLMQRWKGHLQDAKSRVDTTHNYHFLRALNKYPKDSWKHEIIVDKVPIYLANAFEKYWIHYYDTFNSGYNSTIGGNAFPSPKGKPSKKRNLNVYTFYKELEIFFIGTSYELSEKFNISRANINNLLAGKINSTHGLRLVSYLKILRNKKKPIKTKQCTCGLLISNNATLCKSCAHKGNLNPVFGTKRPNNISIAVSNNRRSMADQTLRDWIHPIHGNEQQIKTIDLRDKYKLNISHLHKIAMEIPRYKSYKGWTLAKNYKSTSE